jgi:hypothetical protein
VSGRDGCMCVVRVSVTVHAARRQSGDVVARVLTRGDPGCGDSEPCLCTVSAVRVPFREHENEASVLNVHEVLVFTCARSRSYVLVCCE